MPKSTSGSKVDPRTTLDSRSDLTGVGTPEVGAPTTAEMKAANGKGHPDPAENENDRLTPDATGTGGARTSSSGSSNSTAANLPEGKAELDPEGMAGYRQSDALLGSEGNTK